MGGAEKDRANQMQNEQYAKESAANDEFQKRQQEGYDTAKTHANDLYSSLSSGYKGLATNPTTIKPTDYSGMRGAEDTNRSFMANGGVDDARKSSITGTIGQMKDFGNTGGLSADDMNRMQGAGGYDEFAKTGGYSEADKNNIRARATSVIPAAYQRSIDAQDQMASIQGGYGPGSMAMRSKMLRGSNADASNAALNAETSIADRVNTGRQFGITGIANSSQAANGLRTGNMARGMEDAGNLDMNLAKTVQAGQMWGADSLARTEGDIAGRTAAENQNEAEMGLGQRLSSLQGQASLYGTAPGEVNTNVDQTLQGRGLDNQTQAAIARDKLNGNPSGWQMFTNGVGSIAGGAGGVLQGISSFR